MIMNIKLSTLIHLVVGKIYLKRREDVPIYLRAVKDPGIVLPVNNEKLPNAPQNQNIEPYQSMAYPEETPDEDDGLDNLNLDENQVTMLRKKWNYRCNRKAAKVCRKACISASKSTCNQYDCRRKLRKRFKKECKRHCRSRFMEDD